MTGRVEGEGAVVTGAARGCAMASGPDPAGDAPIVERDIVIDFAHMVRTFARGQSIWASGGVPSQLVQPSVLIRTGGEHA
jgi:hypothetical protein